MTHGSPRAASPAKVFIGSLLDVTDNLAVGNDGPRLLSARGRYCCATLTTTTWWLQRIGHRSILRHRKRNQPERGFMAG